MATTIIIGNKNLKDISPKEVLDIAIIQGVHLSFKHDGEKIWDYPVILDYTNTLFSDTIVIDYQQRRLSDGMEGNIIVFFFNYKDFIYHWHFKHNENTSRPGSRLKIESLKYLIDNGYNVPLY